ncbi:phosphoribosylglycinamide formyltransferase [Paraferrimonas sedimenticola]|uniref:Phosphoribosylglycinamide formyltransferase n=1 Tax=Paraferrimonas sedimenticola TaxID=375674 RepID=A0AA37RNU4_9GAMM|nr:phosphoribosylglycinamide formyltransferase [Paraferrimonas sedimenticola]GLP94786.1 phosphoribosylglycinamide formyltransferase [Paraferrimonas sedimenticola]
MNRPARVAVLISGQGTNLQAIMDANTIGDIDVEFAVVISNKEDAYGLIRAEQQGIPALALTAEAGESRASYDQRLHQALSEYQPDIIVLAGFMRILSDEFVERYLGRMVNIHPSLLPKYPGLNTHQKAIDNGDEEHGASVHFVTPQLDSGPVILQAKVPVFADDDVTSLSERVHVQEHSIYPLVVKWLSQQRVQLKDGQAWLDDQPLPPSGYAAD